MKKAIVLLLALIMLLSAVPAFASNTRASGLFTYEIKGNGTVEITRYNWAIHINRDTIYVPEMLDGYTVTSIGSRAFSKDAQEPIYHLQHDTHINYYKDPVYYNVHLPDTITTIKEFAFFNYEQLVNLEKINIPTSVKTIAPGAFANCRSASFNIDPNHEIYTTINGGLYNKTNKELLSLAGFSWEKDYVIPEGIVSIADYACCFENSGMTRQYSPRYSIELPGTLKSIGNYAFCGTCALIRLPDELETIGDYAFAQAERIENVLPDSVYYLGENVFQNARINGRVSITANSALTEIPAYAFDDVSTYGDDSGESFIDASNIRAVGDYAFDFSPVTFANTTGITQIGENGLGWGSGFELSPRITTIPSGFNLWNIKLTDNIKRIEERAYTVVEDFYLPASITYIDEDAFILLKNCSFIVEKGTYAETWCMDNGASYTYNVQDDLSWLN